MENFPNRIEVKLVLYISSAASHASSNSVMTSFSSSSLRGVFGDV